MELTPEVNDLYRRLITEVNKFGEITVEEKKTSFHESIPANNISSLISFPPHRSKAPGLWNKSKSRLTGFITGLK
jgi:hypothetical protein